MRNRPWLPVSSMILAVAILAVPARAGSDPLTFRDLMKFRQIEDVQVAKDGTRVAYRSFPDRGDGEVVVRIVDGDAEFRVPRGDDPRISPDARWVAAGVVPTQQERDEADSKDDDDKPKPGLALLDTVDGTVVTFERVQSFAFSDDGRWLAYHLHEDPDTGDDGEEADEEANDDEPVGTTLVLRRLATGAEIELAHVTTYAVSEHAPWVAYARAAPGGEDNGAYVRDLSRDDAPMRALREDARGRYTHLVWAEEADRLALVAAVDDDDHEPGPGTVWTWDPSRTDPVRVAAPDDAPDGWTIPSKNELAWSRDGVRLYFGFRPADPAPDGESEAIEEDAPFDPYDVESVVAKRGLDVWHWNDPRIVPNQKKHHEKHKDDTFRAVVHVEDGTVVPLGGPDLPEVVVDDNPRSALGISDAPYLLESTWRGRAFDVWSIDLRTGDRALVAERIEETPSGSPGGRFVAWWSGSAWFLYDAETGANRDLTSGLETPFGDEDWDYPSAPWSYGVAGWVEGDAAVLIHDKFDVWQFPTDGEAPFRITDGNGRATSRRFRVVDVDPDTPYFGTDESVWLTGYHDVAKHRGLFRARVGSRGVETVVDEDRWYGAPVKAEDADVFVFTRERYDEFPDLWTSGPDLTKAVRLSDANPQIERFAWGSAERVEWTGDDGRPLEGILIKPGGYEPGRRYPVLVYFYRLFTDRLFRFNQPVVNHRPSFPVYASHGYAVFLPDIRFEIGRPGLSATKALVSGVDHLVEIGVADPGAIGLHGHSWSGYQTAFVVTQTDRFAAAVAGAPVSNMTSAYSGIRLKSGLARQFQYEAGQSRIGASLDERLHDYIDNSPVFFARHVKTPLLIQFGDRDEAVPWQQGIELYLALRRLGKPCVFLQYRDEPHHLKKYPNKLDYSRKMKAFFDHFLQGAPAPSWWTEGVPYDGD